MVYPIGKIFWPPVYKLWLRKVTGLENIPRDSSFLLAVNHSSYYDTVLMHNIIIPIINKKIHAFVNSRFWDHFISRWIIEWGECIPVYVEKNVKRKNDQAFKKALQYIKKGDPIQIFPEGGRSYDGKLKKGYNGAMKLALISKIPLIPVGIIGSNKILTKGKFFPNFVRCEVKIGEPIDLSKYYDKKITKKLLNQQTRVLMQNIAKLIGQKYRY